MITEPNEFIQRLQELQDSSSVTYSTLPSNEPRFIIDANSRTIKIPPEFQFLGVKNDHKAETVYFEIDRYFDDEDLSTHTCVVQFENKSGEGSIYPVTIMDTESIDGKIIFGWEILSDATTIVGDIIFSVRFYSLDNYVFTYNFNTLPAKSVILDTLNVDDPTVVENYPSELEAWLDRMNDLSQNVVKPEDVELLDTKMNTLETSFGELETNVNSSVDELKSDLSQLENQLVIRQMKNLEIDWITGYDVRSGGNPVENGSYSYAKISVKKGDVITIAKYKLNISEIIPLCYIVGYDGVTYDKYNGENFENYARSQEYTFTASTNGVLYVNFNGQSNFCNISKYSTYVEIINNTNVIKTIDNNILNYNVDYSFNGDYTLKSNSGFNISDYIKIVGKTIVKAVGNKPYLPCCVLYDKDKKIIRGINPNTEFIAGSIEYIEDLEIDEKDACYIRVGTHPHSNANFNCVSSVVTNSKEIELLEDIQSKMLPILNGKKIYIFGDSISDMGSSPSDDSAIYGYWLEKDFGANVTSYACYGSGYGFDASWNPTNNGVNNILRRISDASDEEPDIVILAGGTNDWDFEGGGALDLGDVEDGKADTNTQTFCYRVGACIRALNLKYPTSKILCITPLPRFSAPWNQEGVISSNLDTLNHKSHTLVDYRNALISICNWYSVPILDMTYNSNIKFTNTYLGDGLHPTYWYARNRYAPIVAKKIDSI